MSDLMQFNLKILLLLSFAHGVTDITQGAIPILLPFFKAKFALTYTQVGLIVLVSNLASSVIQPAFGYFSDRTNAKWIMSFGCIVSALGVGFSGIMPTFALLLCAVGISGIGSAAFHPEGSKYALYVSGHKKASAMSIFSVGGNFGYALGSIVVIFLLMKGNLANTLYLAIPGVLIGFILRKKLSRLVRKVQTGKTDKAERSIDQKMMGGFFILIVFIVFRSWIVSGLSTYIPFYYINLLHKSPVEASYLVAAFLVSCGFGTFFGGSFSDKFGRKLLLVGSMLFSLVLLAVFPYVGHAVSIGVLVALGFVLSASYSTTVILGQQMLPNHVGMASGITLGFSFGLGGLGVLLLGRFADVYGILLVFHIFVSFGLLCLVLSCLLPTLEAKQKEVNRFAGRI